MIKQNKGFTLIELLVVIAIIGVLASVVLAAVNSARTKGIDAAVKSNLANARAQAEIFYDTGTTYAGACSVGATTINKNVLAAATSSGLTSITVNGTGSTTTATCNATAAGWAADAPLKSGGMWCVDSTGASKAEAAGLGANAVVCA